MKFHETFSDLPSPVDFYGWQGVRNESGAWPFIKKAGLYESSGRVWILRHDRESAQFAMELRVEQMIKETEADLAFIREEERAGRRPIYINCVPSEITRYPMQ